MHPYPTKRELESATEQQKYIAELKAEIVTLRELLTQYGNHLAGCCNKFDESYPCKCGWKRERQIVLGE